METTVADLTHSLDPTAMEVPGRPVQTVGRLGLTVGVAVIPTRPQEVVTGRTDPRPGMPADPPTRNCC